MTNSNLNDQENTLLIETIHRFHRWNEFMSVPRIALFWSKVKIGKDNECWSWVGNVFDETGYGRFSVKHFDKTRTFGAHRVAFELSKGLIPKNLHVLHSCIGNRICCNPAHLRAGSPLENVQDTISQGRNYKGATHHSAKLSEESVREIRKMISQGSSQKKIAALFGVSRLTISKIARGQTWKDVK